MRSFALKSFVIYLLTRFKCTECDFKHMFAKFQDSMPYAKSESLNFSINNICKINNLFSFVRT